MSESEKKKRLEYRKRRKTRIAIQVVVAIMFIVAFIPLALISREKAKDVEIGYTETGTVDYKVYLKQNDFYEEEFLGKDKEYVASLIDDIVIDFDYKFALDKDSLNNDRVDLSNKMYSVTYQLYGELIISKEQTGNAMFTKKYPLVDEYTVHTIVDQPTKISHTATIDYAEYNSLANAFINTYNLENQGVESTLKLFMSAKVGGICEGTVSHFETLSIPLTEETVDINFTSSVPTNNNKILVCDKGDGQPFGYLSLISLGLGIIVLLVMGIYAVLTRNYDIEYDIKVKRLVVQYKSYVQKIKNNFCADGYQVLKVGTFKEMLDIRDTTQSPILMHENQDRTMTQFMIPTQNSLLYLFEIKVEDYDEIYGFSGAVNKEVTATELPKEEKAVEEVKEAVIEQENEQTEQAEVENEHGYRSNISYDYSFVAKLHMSAKETKEYYKDIISFIQSYGVNVTRTWDKEKVCVGRNVLAVISFKGMKLSTAFKLDPKEYENSKYKLVDMSTIKRFEKTPAFMKVTSDRKTRWAIELLQIVFEKEGLVNKNLTVKVKNIPTKSRNALVKENLIRIKEKKSK
ncbi:MAG: hypothetical protein IJC07_03165 [Clostridia bacterium]|nr:hypothetical protein [Clostridia bacterium]